MSNGVKSYIHYNESQDSYPLDLGDDYRNLIWLKGYTHQLNRV